MKDTLRHVHLSWILLIALLMSCSHNNNITDNRPVVSVGEKTLTYGRLKSVVPQNLAMEDSIVFVQDYIKRWVKSELLLRKAEQNLSPSEKNVDQLLEEYRRSLLIHTYEQKLLEQKFNPQISDSEITRCYEQMEDNFKLEGPIIKGMLVILPNSAPKTDTFEQLFKKHDLDDMVKLESYCVQNARKYEIFLDNWYPIKDISDVWPESITKPDQFVRKGNYYHAADSVNHYYLNIGEYKLSGELAPIEYLEERIKSILINKKRLAFIRQIEQDLYNEGNESNSVKYY